jgi:hypothetical protein
MLGYIRSRRPSCPPTAAQETIVPSHNRTKHIDVRYHYIRETVAHDHVRIVKVPTGLNRADLFTTPVTAELFHRHVSALMRP